MHGDDGDELAVDDDDEETGVYPDETIPYRPATAHRALRLPRFLAPAFDAAIKDLRALQEAREARAPEGVSGRKRSPKLPLSALGPPLLNSPSGSRRKNCGQTHHSPPHRFM